MFNHYGAGFLLLGRYKFPAFFLISSFIMCSNSLYASLYPIDAFPQETQRFFFPTTGFGPKIVNQLAWGGILIRMDSVRPLVSRPNFVPGPTPG